MGNFLSDKSAQWDESHRLWPLPDIPWIITQTWNNLLFAHYPVDLKVLQSLIPDELTLDTYNGTGWVGIVAFRITGSRVRGVPPLPGMANFPEINVRTYVTIDEKPGVYFLSMDASNILVVGGARTLYHLPYVTSEMKVDYNHPFIKYKSNRLDNCGAALNCSYRPISDPYNAPASSFEKWMAERYCLYTVNKRGELRRCDILHQPWLLQKAEANISLNTMLSSQGIPVESDKPILHFSKKKKVRMWPLVNPFER